MGSNAYSILRIAYSEEEYARSGGLKCVFRIPYSVGALTPQGAHAGALRANPPVRWDAILL